MTYAIICKIARQVSTYTKVGACICICAFGQRFVGGLPDRVRQMQNQQVTCIRLTYYGIYMYVLYAYAPIECSLTTTVDRHRHYHPQLYHQLYRHRHHRYVLLLSLISVQNRYDQYPFCSRISENILSL